MQVYNSTGSKIAEKTFPYFSKNDIKTINAEQMTCNPCFIRITTKDFTQTFKLFKF